jgi:GT2 family glycosyltransferase
MWFNQAMATRLSIVIVNWKTPELLAGCLESIYADKNASQFEIWVVDNASNDGSVEMLRSRFPSVFVIANDSNLGFPKACNQAIPLSHAPYVVLLNPDTVVIENALSEMVEFLDKNPQCGAVGPRVNNPDGSLQLACRRSFPSPAAAFYRMTYLSKLFPNNPRFSTYNLTYADPDAQLDVDVLSGACMMVRKTVIDQIGLLDEEIFMCGEDVDWCWRIKKAGWRVIYLPAAVVFHYHGASTKLRPIGATRNLHTGMAIFYRKHLAPQYPAIFNACVYAAIELRCLLFMVLYTVHSALRPRKVVSVIPAKQNSRSLAATAAGRSSEATESAGKTAELANRR